MRAIEANICRKFYVEERIMNHIFHMKNISGLQFFQLSCLGCWINLPQTLEARLFKRIYWIGRSSLSAGSCSALINPGSVCHFSHPILQSYTVIIGLNSVVKSLLPMSVDKSRKLFVAKILRLHYFYQKWALPPLQGWTIGGACPLDTFGGNVI